jgi:hypothetical protein
MTYQGILEISNEIRFVLDTARQVNLASQNASLAARRAGNAKGFQAVSSELKSFSNRLAQCMSNMSEDILAISQGVSSGYREIRLSNYLHEIVTNIGDSSLLAKAFKQIEYRKDQTQNILGDRLQGLGLQLSRSMRQCNNGRALARSAMIEASSGGEFEAMLKNVALDIEYTIEDIHARLKVIWIRLQNEKGTI